MGPKFPSLVSLKPIPIHNAAEDRLRFERLLRNAVPDYCVAGNVPTASLQIICFRTYGGDRFFDLSFREVVPIHNCVNVGSKVDCVLKMICAQCLKCRYNNRTLVISYIDIT